MVSDPQKSGYKLLLVWHGDLDVQGKTGYIMWCFYCTTVMICLFRIMHESNLYHYNDSINNFVSLSISLVI